MDIFFQMYKGSYSKMQKKIVHMINSLELGGAEMMLYKLLMNTDKTRYEHKVVPLRKKGVLCAKIKAYPFTVCRDADIIVGWMYHSNLVSFLLAKIFRKKLIWTIHSEKLDPEIAKKTTILVNKICARLSRFVDKIIVPSIEGIRNHIAYGYDQSKFKQIPIGFEAQKFKFNPLAKKRICQELGVNQNAKILLTVGRWSKEKNYDMLLKAFLSLKNKNVILLMCGKNLVPENKQLDCKNVKLLGVRDDIRDLMSAADIFVLSSDTESFPNVLGEAMLCQTPCIATDVGMCRHIIGETGFIVPVGDSKLMAEKIDEALAKNTKSLGKAARERIINLFDIKKIAKEYEGEF